MLVARRFVFFDFNLKAKALIVTAPGLRWPRVRGNEKWRKRFFVYRLSGTVSGFDRLLSGNATNYRRNNTRFVSSNDRFATARFTYYY